MDDLFAPPVYEWKRLSPSFRSLRRVTTLTVIPILFSIPAVIVGAASGQWWISAIIWALAAVIVAIRFGLIERTWQSWGYVEREDDLYITHGVLFRTPGRGAVRPDAVGRGRLRASGTSLRPGHRDLEDGQPGNQRRHPGTGPR